MYTAGGELPSTSTFMPLFGGPQIITGFMGGKGLHLVFYFSPFIFNLLDRGGVLQLYEVKLHIVSQHRYYFFVSREIRNKTTV